MADQALQQLTSTAKIERDRGVLDLQRFLNTAKDTEVQHLESHLICTLRDAEVPWETVHGALMGSAALITHNSATHSEDFARDVQEQSIKLLEHKESRIRIAAGRDNWHTVYTVCLCVTLINRDYSNTHFNTLTQ